MAGTRRIFLLLLILLMLLPLRTAVPARAQNDGPVLQPSAAATFGESVRLGLRADEAGGVSAMTLFLQPVGAPQVYEVNVPFSPAETLEVAVTVPAAVIGLQPFQRLSYGWELQTADGVRRVPPQVLAFEDTRFTWQELEQGGITAHWSGGEPFFGDQVLAIAAAALQEAGQVLPLAAARPFDIYVYPSSADLRAALQTLGADEAALREAGVILVTAVNPQTAATELGQSLPPAVVDLLAAQTAGGAAAQPWWLLAGLGGRLQGQRDPRSEALLAEALAAGTTTPLAALCAAPAQTGDAALLAEAQSTAVLDYVLRTRGETAVRALAAAYDGGADCAAGLVQALGQSPDELHTAWLNAAAPRSPLSGFWSEFGLYLLLLLGGGLMAVLIYRVTRRGEDVT